MAVKVNVKTLKEIADKEPKYTSGHRACAGCGCSVAVSQIIRAVEGDLVVGFATGCMEVVTTIFPYTSWNTPYIHNAFENVAATISGVETAYHSLRKQKKIDPKKKINFIAFGGDGGTYDIGLQSLSGAMERNHDMLYICYDNEAYMNTGIQRSSATPLGAAVSTAPAGEVIPGKQQNRKNLTDIIAAHHIPYVAQASPHNWMDLMRKVRRALEIEGATFINVMGTCFRGWRFPMEKSIEMARLATETCFWPLFEVEYDRWKLNYKPKEKLPITEWIKHQGRFDHLFKPEFKYMIPLLQENVDRNWELILWRTGQGECPDFAANLPEKK